MRILVNVAALLAVLGSSVAACGTTTTTGTDAGGEAGSCAASPSGTHTGTCPSVLFQGVPNFDVPCTDRCLACNPTGPDR